MVVSVRSKKILFPEVSKYIDEFINAVKVKKGSLMATDKWTVDDVLRHVAFWHTNYAANYKALAENKVRRYCQDLDIK